MSTPTPLNDDTQLLEDESASSLEDGIALCLSGGGFRAMIFHLGALIRLNELGVLQTIKRVSSVSGGSITAAWLGVQWETLKADQFSPESLRKNVVDPVCKLADRTIDYASVGWGTFNPWSDISDEVAKAYDKFLYEGRTLQDLTNEPRFVINATNVKTGSLWRFSKPYMADYRVGMIENPDLPLSTAVAASSAFPPFLSPLTLSLDQFRFKSGIPQELTNQVRQLRTEAVLTDGGVYDNLGLETVFKRYKTILISDGGRRMADDLNPKDDWARHSRRLIDLLQHQVSSLRRRMAISEFNDTTQPHEGTYWGVQTNIGNYELEDSLECPLEKTTALANIATRLAEMEPVRRNQLMNWGYGVCDAAIRRHVPGFEDAEAPSDFPFPEAGLG